MPAAALKFFTLEYISRTYKGYTHVYADGSVRPGSSAIGVWIPSARCTIEIKLSHETSSTATELAAVRAALHYISGHHAQQWVIFLDSRSALQALRKLNNNRSQLVCEIAEIHTMAVREGHEIILQWVPGHSDIQGNIRSDAAASAGHLLSNTTQLPFSREDSNALILASGWAAQRSEWQDPHRRYLPLHAIDPHCDFRFPRGLNKRCEGVLHRLCLNVAFTRSFKFKIGWEDSPLCRTCGVRETVNHLLCVCPRYAAARKTAASSLSRVRHGGSIELFHFLGPWANSADSTLGTKVLLQFLRETELDKSPILKQHFNQSIYYQYAEKILLTTHISLFLQVTYSSKKLHEERKKIYAN